MVAELKKKFSLGLFLPAFLLSGVGLVSIYSSSISRHSYGSFVKQILWLALCLSIFSLVSFLDLRFLRTNSRVVFALYVASIFGLLGLLIFAPVVRGVKGWYQIGPFSFDPEPLASLILVIVLAKYFSRKHSELRQFRTLIFSGIYVALPMILVFLQPDLGSSISLLVVWLGSLIFSGLPLRHFFALVCLFLVVGVLGWHFFLQDYQKQRIASFINPQIDAQGVSWSVNQSKIAIGAGGIFGKGLGKGSQTQYGFLSEPKTDFIFSAIAEEFGFLGVALLVGLLFWLLYCLVEIVFAADSNFVRLFTAGVAFLILSQSFINIGMCLGLFPVVGIPLPFVSYGGSQLLAFWLALGIFTSLKRI